MVYKEIFYDFFYSHTSESEKYKQGEIIPFCPLCCESEAILSKTFRPGNRDGVFIWKNFHPGCRDLSWKNRDLGNRAIPPFHMNTPKFLQRI